MENVELHKSKNEETCYIWEEVELLSEISAQDVYQKLTHVKKNY